MSAESTAATEKPLQAFPFAAATLAGGGFSARPSGIAKSTCKSIQALMYDCVTHRRRRIMIPEYQPGARVWVTDYVYVVYSTIMT